MKEIGPPAGRLQFTDANIDKNPPTPADLRHIFDEHERGGDLSTDSWLALRRLGWSIDGNPAHFGALLCTPDDDDFWPQDLRGKIPDSRLDELIDEGSPPTESELEQWREGQAAETRAGGPGLHAIHGWWIADDLSRKKLLVTLHGDQSTFDGVVGLYNSSEEALNYLQSLGSFKWEW